ncbi:hypothetical protein Pyn_40080 [Prunus yedoensis var. nudiflora]|uniref:Uncharacterized protein n=1 Tax=Prunus yedoensis var. nudiflora TaxID=2094558 RepID=A0A314U736_PRUYE|nr:hypothetical protein Pyn_40080 [Prunus yedoensis var. nudiflora]
MMWEERRRTKGCKEEQHEEEKKSQDEATIAGDWSPWLGYMSSLGKRSVVFGRELGMICCSKATGRRVWMTGSRVKSATRCLMFLACLTWFSYYFGVF